MTLLELQDILSQYAPPPRPARNHKMHTLRIPSKPDDEVITVPDDENHQAKQPPTGPSEVIIISEDEEALPKQPARKSAGNSSVRSQQRAPSKLIWEVLMTLEPEQRLNDDIINNDVSLCTYKPPGIAPISIRFMESYQK